MDDFNSMIKDSRPTLVDFFATWCGPCKAQSPILAEVKNRVGEKANIIKVDIDKNPSLAAQYNVRSVPTLILFKCGMAVWRVSGLQSAEMLEEKIADHYETKSDEVGAPA